MTTRTGNPYLPLPSPAESPGFIIGRCNPYGHETGGPRHLFGGLFSAAYEGRYKWVCEAPADGRYVMHCPYGHTGPPIRLCYPHVYMIGKRMSGVCTRCAMPPEARELWEDIGHCRSMIVKASRAGDEAEVKRLASRFEDLDKLSAEQFRRGIVRQVPMRLEEIS